MQIPRKTNANPFNQESGRVRLSPNSAVTFQPILIAVDRGKSGAAQCATSVT